MAACLSREHAISTDGLWDRVPRFGPAVVDTFAELGLIDRKHLGFGKVDLTLTDLGETVRHAVVKRAAAIGKAVALKECDDCTLSRFVRGTAYTAEGGSVMACDAPDAVPTRVEGFARCGAMRADETRCELAARWFIRPR